MKCSDCSAEIKPVVALDIDGTLADYHGHFIKFLESYLGFSVMRQFQGGEGFKEWVMEFYRISERDWHDIKLAYRQGAQKRSAPVYRHAMALTEEIRGHGAEIWLCTTRPYLRLDSIDPDTRAWLDRHQIVWDHLIYDEDKYEVLTHHIDSARIAAVLEDLPWQYDRAAHLFGPDVPILNKTVWNSKDSRPNQVTGLDYARHEIIDRITQWRALHK